MIIMSIRTDNPEAEIGLWDGRAQLTYEKWPAHRMLAETIHTKMEAALRSQGKTWSDVHGIVVFEGPGSFTGLRIGMTVANTLAFDLHIPIAASGDDQWVEKGIDRLLNGDQEEIALPFYGRDANITVPRK